MGSCGTHMWQTIERVMAPPTFCSTQIPGVIITTESLIVRMDSALCCIVYSSVVLCPRQ